MTPVRPGTRRVLEMMAVAVSVGAVGASIAAQVPDVTLELDKSVAQRISGREEHVYRLSLDAGMYARVNVEQQGIDVLVRIAPAAGPGLESDAELAATGPESIEWVSDQAAAYRISVVGKGGNETSGRYQIQLSQVRPATTNDRELHNARLMVSESIQAARAGRYDDAVLLGQQVLDVRERVLGPSHTDVASALNNLGEFWRIKGEYAKAEPLYLRALEIRRQIQGPEHRDVAVVLNNLGILYNRKAEYDKAEETYQRVLELKEKALGPNHADVASAWHNLANVSYNRGDFDKAAQLYRRALAIYQKEIGSDTPQAAETMNNLGAALSEKGDFPAAASVLREALRIRERVLGPEHPGIVSTLINLAEGDMALGRFDEAEGLYRRALAIRERTLGPEHPDLATSLHAYGNVRRSKGDLSEAERFYRRALDIRTGTFGDRHPSVANVLGDLSILYWLKGDIPEAVRTQARASEIITYNVGLNIWSGSERQKLAYLRTLSDTADRIISLQVGIRGDNERARQLAVSTMLQRKGRVLDAMAASLSLLRQQSGEEERHLLDQLDEVLARLSALALAGPGRSRPADHRAQLAALEERRESLEADVNRRSAVYRLHSPVVDLRAIEEAIPEDAALLEFALYRPFNPQAAETLQAFGAPRYIAYVLQRNGVIASRDLGDAVEIDGRVRKFRQALSDPTRRDVIALGRALDERIMEPLRPLVDGVTRLLISPDGELNLVPFEALVDPRSRYLIERFEVSYLTSGRDLPRLQIHRASQNRPLIIASPRFGEPQAEVAANSSRRSVTAARDLQDVYFAPLVGTAQEAQSIRALFPDAIVLTGDLATKAALRRTTAPQILHIATHGFFLENPDAIANPLLRSGLALAGANLRARSGSAGILTALEASSLNLWGTKLVTLSACDTGLGDVKNGEGVFGLRRALVLAGAETVVMSLWAISDYATRDIMTRYYQGLQRGLGRSEALRRVELGLLQRKDRHHPFYWASFIQSGEWGRLDGTH